MFNDTNTHLPFHFDLHLLTPWDQTQPQTKHYKNSSLLTPKPQKKSLKQFPNIFVRKHSLNSKPIRKQSPRNIGKSTRPSDLKEIDIFASIKSEAIESSGNFPLKGSMFRGGEKRQGRESDRWRRFKVSSKFGNKWVHVGREAEKETLTVDIRKWKRLKTLDVESNDSYNFVSRKKTMG